VLGSALTMDKVQTKRVWQALDLPTPRYAVYRPGEDVGEAIEQVGLPVVVKPSREGSSVGITKVRSPKDLPGALELAARYDGELVIETLIEGAELTVGILGPRRLPSIRIVPKTGFYDYHAKYVAEDTQYLCPGLEGEDEQEIRRLGLRRVPRRGRERLGPGGRDARPGRAQLAAGVNTTPGMTSHSLVPKAARAIGIGFEDLVWRILETSFVDRSAKT
jgi:D-alanine-D-alanine ligase